MKTKNYLKPFLLDSCIELSVKINGNWDFRCVVLSSVSVKTEGIDDLLTIGQIFLRSMKELLVEKLERNESLEKHNQWRLSAMAAECEW